MHRTTATDRVSHPNGGGPLRKLAALFQRNEESRAQETAAADIPTAYEWRNRTPRELHESLTALYDGYVAHEWLQHGKRPAGAPKEAGSERMPLDRFTPFRTSTLGRRSTVLRENAVRYDDTGIAMLAHATVAACAKEIRCSSGWTSWPWRPCDTLPLRGMEVELQTSGRSQYYVIGHAAGERGWRTNGTLVWKVARRREASDSQTVECAVPELAPIFDWLMDTLDVLQEAGLTDGLPQPRRD